MVENQNISSFEQLKKYSIISVDTGDVKLVKELKQLDSTTNPTLILKSINDYPEFLEDAIAYSTKKLNCTDSSNKELLDLIIMKTCVNFGKAILENIDGVVSTEIDARSSFNVEENIKLAKKVIELYEEVGIKKERVLIKLSANWEGIIAAEQLEKEGIKCNLTLVFSLIQSAACAEKGITLISPFVGRVTDFVQKKTQITYKPSEEPGVLLVKDIHDYYRCFSYKTLVMAASLRNTSQGYELAGVDKLTIPPAILQSMKSDNTQIEKKLNDEDFKNKKILKLEINEDSFKKQIESDEVSSTLLKKGIESFSNDIISLEKIIKEKLSKLN